MIWKNILKVYVLLIVVLSLSAETLFEVKDSSNNKVLDVSTDGLRIMNMGDTVMVISSNEIKANLQRSKGLSRSFSVTTASSKGSGTDLMIITADSTRFGISDTGTGFGVSSLTLNKEKSVTTDFLKVSNEKTQMREGSSGDIYTDFSPDNIFLGLNSGINSRPGHIEPYYGKYNTFLGNQSGYSNTYGFGNIFIGYQAGYFSTTSNQNISIGYQAGYNMTGQSNTLVGHLVGKGMGNGGDYNSFFGRAAGFSIGTAASNTLIGALSGSALTNGNSNTLVGSEAGKGQSGAAFSNNTVLGSYAATQLSTGGNNVILGYNAGSGLSSGSGNVMIGYQAGNSEAGSNKLYIDNSNTTTPLIFGDFSSDYIRINGKLGVGTIPSYRFHTEDTNASGDDPAVYGKHNVTDGYGIGVKGEGGYMGVHGVAYMISAYGYGVYGNAYGGSGSGTRYGVYGTASGGATNWAGYFNGNVEVTGTLTKSADEIKVDHPLDPANKYLVHSGVNSSEMLNIYNGNVILNSEGSAIVDLPNWFEVFNNDYRYQLTPIGGWAGLYISREISGNKFEISGGKPGMKVSWQVTGIRNDNYAKANPIINETVKKADEKGYYIHPEAFGKKEDMGIEYQIQKKQENEASK